MISNVDIELAFKQKAPKGDVKKQDKNSYEIIEAVMREGLKRGIIWWFAYELMGYHEINGARYWLSYKASTRVSEMAGFGTVVSRETNGKLNLYRLASLNGAKSTEPARVVAETCPHGLPVFVQCPHCTHPVHKPAPETVPTVRYNG